MTEAPVAVDLPDRPMSPTGWFVRLDLALEEGDWETAREAAEGLRALGIGIRLYLDRTVPAVDDRAEDPDEPDAPAYLEPSVRPA